MKDPIVYYSDVDYARKSIEDTFRETFDTQPGALTSAALFIPTDPALDPCVLYGLTGNALALTLASHFALHVDVYTLRADEQSITAVPLRPADVATGDIGVYLDHDRFMAGGVYDLLDEQTFGAYSDDEPELDARMYLIAAVKRCESHRLIFPATSALNDNGETYGSSTADLFDELLPILQSEMGDLSRARYDQLHITPEGVLHFVQKPLPVQP